MKYKVQFVIAMVLFGSIGLFVMNISMESVAIVHWRTIIGSIFLTILLACKGNKIQWNLVRKNGIPLLLSGIFLGTNWVFLFEAYYKTSVGIATILYYSGPGFVLLVTPLLFREKIRKNQVIGIMGAMVGMVCMNAVGMVNGQESQGIYYALVAAVLYAGIMIANQYIEGLQREQSTLIQLSIAFIVITIYQVISTGQLVVLPQTEDWLVVIILGIVHTGIAYLLYFGAIPHMQSSDVAILSYIDPVSALVCSYFFLGETLGMYEVCGAILIFGGVLFAQLNGSTR